MMYTQKSLDISNLTVKNINFMTQHANMSEVKEGKTKNRNTLDYLEKVNNKLHNWLLHFEFPLDISLWMP